MPNWGVPDYNVDEDIDYEGLHARILEEDPSAILEWPIKKYPVRPGYDLMSVNIYCVQDKDWQRVRLSLKGLPTHKKLAMLVSYWESHVPSTVGYGHGHKSENQKRVEIQVGNYLGALRRGGQLNARNQIRKYK